MFCAAWWVSIKFSTFNQGCATTFMRSPLPAILMTNKYTKIVCTEDVLWGSPRIVNRRLAICDVVSFITDQGLPEVMKERELSKQEIREALEYCSKQACIEDKPLNYCYNCRLRNEKDEPEDFTKYEEFELDGDLYVRGEGVTYLGSMQEFIAESAGIENWKIAQKLMLELDEQLR
jgi:uncharacterized protein (DUF433 family)